ncbi:hypothetical protein HMI54_007611 [Coelomomyces lativittatus]|nr:hypothetical protein HMI54_007611 [Coelomomyces lativittatus]
MSFKSIASPLKRSFSGIENIHFKKLKINSEKCVKVLAGFFCRGKEENKKRKLNASETNSVKKRPFSGVENLKVKRFKISSDSYLKVSPSYFLIHQNEKMKRTVSTL